MYLKRLSLTDFRAFSRLDIEFPRRVILFTGANAQGKTTILEAISYLANFSSFHVSQDRQLLNFNMPVEPIMVGRIIGEFYSRGREHTLEVRFIQEYNGNSNQARFRKQVLLDGYPRESAISMVILMWLVFCLKCRALLKARHLIGVLI